MWPTISNINPAISSKIKSYANDNLAASKLNAWVRVYSGANAGLILQSNTDFKIFTAAGEAGNSIYGNSQLSGTIGRTFDPSGAVVTGAGRALRPSPVITSMNSKEGQDQISRTCEFSITCFSLQQLEEIQTYFMEPGYSVGVEWGWNTSDSALGLVNTSGGIVNQIADVTLNNNELTAKRIKTIGEYDIFLGFIVGASVSSDGENFKVDVKLRGAPSLPTYLQSQNRITVSSSGQIKVDADKSKALYDEAETIKEGVENERDRRFKTMFNDLPSFRQTEGVKNLKDKYDRVDFINFDKVLQKKIDTFMQASGPEFYSVFQQDTIDVTIAEGASVEVEKEKLFSKNRYIRFGVAIDILNEIGAVDKYLIGDKPISFKFDIENSIIGAFPIMFSTKASKLIIPGFIPNFVQTYFLKSNEVEQDSQGRLNKANAIRTPLLKDFVQFTDLNNFGLKEKGGYWGYLKNLYVNFDMFKEKIEQKNKTIREILLDILNEMSSAVNSFWNFQIVEGSSTDGNIILTVVDENWIGENPNPDDVVTFIHSGVGSAFLNASLDISIPAEMANKVINTRLGNNSQPDMSNIKVGSLFNAETDLFLPRVQGVGGGDDETTTGEEGTDGASDIEKNQKRIAELRSKIEPYVDPDKTEPRDNFTNYFAKNGQPLYSTDKNGNITSVSEYGGVVTGLTDAEEIELNNLIQTTKTAVVEQLQSRLTSYLEKIDVVPRPHKMPETIDVGNLINVVETYFFVFCFDDTDFFDLIKNYRFEVKSGNGLSQPLPIKYSFTILGNSGIRRGDTFKIQGIPSKYAENGIFQVTGVEHSISGMKWETTIEALYRQIQ